MEWLDGILDNFEKGKDAEALKRKQDAEAKKKEEDDFLSKFELAINTFIEPTFKTASAKLVAAGYKTFIEVDDKSQSIKLSVTNQKHQQGTFLPASEPTIEFKADKYKRTVDLKYRHSNSIEPSIKSININQIDSQFTENVLHQYLALVFKVPQ